MTTPKIRVRSYNVGFGDCLLVSIPDAGETRHLLIDFGNAPGKGSSNAAFPAIARDIRDQTGGHLDVVIMTHEHLDHMEGFYSQRTIFDQMTIDQVWMSIPSHPDYYQDYPNAKKHKSLVDSASQVASTLRSRSGFLLAPSFEALLLNNLTNQDRIEYVRNLSDNDPRYLRRGSRVGTRPASESIKFFFLAPERDMSVYYGSGQHQMTMMVSALSIDNDDENAWTFPQVPRAGDNRPRNLSRSDWKELRDSIQTGIVSTIRTIDQAKNNTSLVFLIEAHGKRLLFPADAELESWECIKENAGNHLAPVDFLKVSHHGSRNGTPTEILDQILPVERKEMATVLLSTKKDVYGTTNPVPDTALIAELKRRCGNFASTEGSTATWVEVEV